jgi:hypothetical protein
LRRRLWVTPAHKTPTKHFTSFPYTLCSLQTQTSTRPGQCSPLNVCKRRHGHGASRHVTTHN